MRGDGFGLPPLGFKDLELSSEIIYLYDDLGLDPMPRRGIIKVTMMDIAVYYGEPWGYVTCLDSKQRKRR